MERLYTEGKKFYRRCKNEEHSWYDRRSKYILYENSPIMLPSNFNNAANVIFNKYNQIDIRTFIAECCHQDPNNIVEFVSFINDSILSDDDVEYLLNLPKR